MYVPTAEQEDFTSSLRGFLDRYSPESRVRTYDSGDSSYDEQLWKSLISNYDVAGLAVPGRLGGAGYGLVELALAAQELGRVLAVVPLLSSAALAGLTLRECEGPAAEGYLREVASGARTAALAYVEGDVSRTGTGPTAVGALTGESQMAITGTTPVVVDGGSAGLLVVAVDVAGEPAICVLDSSAEGVDRTELQTLDGTRGIAGITFDRAQATLLCSGATAERALARSVAMASVVLAFEQIGGARQALELCLAFLRQRTQFARPIGSFQAIKHRCADLFVRIERADALAWHAAWTATESPEDLPVAAALSRAACSEAYLDTATANLHLHGGMGFTAENSAHLYLRRAKSTSLLMGTPTQNRLAAWTQLSANNGRV